MKEWNPFQLGLRSILFYVTKFPFLITQTIFSFFLFAYSAPSRISDEENQRFGRSTASQNGTSRNVPHGSRPHPPVAIRFEPEPWISNMSPSHVYSPQIGDRVVYFPQGHRKFKSTVLDRIDKERKDVIDFDESSSEVVGDILRLNYLISTTQLLYCSLDISLLSLVESDQNETPNRDSKFIPNGKIITVHFHRSKESHFQDFVILWSTYLDSLNKSFSIGDTVILQIEDYNPQNKESPLLGKILRARPRIRGNAGIGVWEKYTVERCAEEINLPISS